MRRTCGPELRHLAVAEPTVLVAAVGLAGVAVLAALAAGLAAGDAAPPRQMLGGLSHPVVEAATPTPGVAPGGPVAPLAVPSAVEPGAETARGPAPAPR